MMIYTLSTIVGELAVYHYDKEALACARRIAMTYDGGDTKIVLTAPNGEGPAPTLINVLAYQTPADVRFWAISGLLADSPVIVKLNQ